MREIDDVYYYTMGDVAAIINKTRLTIRNWVVYSEELYSAGCTPLIPIALRINKHRLFTKEQVEEIIKFSKTKRKGIMAEYYRKKCGTRGKEIQKRIDAKVKNEPPKKVEKYKPNMDHYAGGNFEEMKKRLKYLKKSLKNQEDK